MRTNRAKRSSGSWNNQPGRRSQSGSSSSKHAPQKKDSYLSESRTAKDAWEGTFKPTGKGMPDARDTGASGAR
jgi:hypothetical protein